MDRQWYPSIDWQEFQKNLFKNMPFTDNDLHVKGIENFVQKAIDSIPKTMMQQPVYSPFSSSNLDYNIFETHRSIFVRCRIPSEASPKSIRILANRRKLKIEYTGSTQEISLPSDVKVSRTSARIRDRILEIRMQKSPHSEPFREIFIRDVD